MAKKKVRKIKGKTPVKAKETLEFPVKTYKVEKEKLSEKLGKFAKKNKIYIVLIIIVILGLIFLGFGKV